MAFWLIACLVALIVVTALIAAFTQKGNAPVDSGADFDMQVYRDQLNELERDLERGTVVAEEAERTRVEISRRLLEADRKAQAAAAGTAAPKNLTRVVAILSTAVILGGGFGLYWQLGANRIGQPNFPDLPLKTRLAASSDLQSSRTSQAEAEAKQPAWPGPSPDLATDYMDLITQLRAAVTERPDELHGLSLLADHEARIGNFIAAHTAKSRAIELQGDSADAEDFAQYADLLVLAAGGYVSPKAEAALNQALSRDPRNPVARYYSGLMYAQIGRPDRGFQIWRELLEEGPAEAVWNVPIRNQILQMAAMAGVDYTLPSRQPAQPPLAGPSRDDIAAAGAMSTDDRNQMVNDMVARLSERLANEGGTAPEWAQLINALGVLGQKDRAAAIWAEARQVFGDDPRALEIVRRSAVKAGISDAATSPPPVTPAPDVAVTSPAAPTDEATQPGTIQDMVTQLAERLASQGGTASEWAQLIRSAGVLGNMEWAASIWTEAQQVFAPYPDQLAIIRDAAESAGVAE